jgi:putative zinc finger/helix-turn-helix YgiT family protein
MEDYMIEPLDNATQAETRDCPYCDEGTATLSNRRQEFVYGSGSDAVTLAVNVPVWSCDGCDHQFTDWRAEEIRHDAVCDHLGRLRPGEIRALREAHNLSQEQFATLTGIGIASIKRWEAGNLIQGEGFDRYIRLLRIPLVFKELQSQRIGEAQRFEPKFRTDISPKVRIASSIFSLQPLAVAA